MDLDDFPDGIIIAGPDGAVEYVNHRVKVMARAVGDEMIGMHLNEAVPFDDLSGHSWYDSTKPYDGMATRPRLARALEILRTKVQQNPPKKHGLSPT